MDNNVIKRIIAWYRGSITARLNTFFVAVIIMLLAFSLYMNSLLSSFSSSYAQRINSYYETLWLQNYIAGCNEAMSEYLRSGNRANLTRFNELVTVFERDIKNLRDARVVDSHSASLIRSIEDAYYTYHTECCYAAQKFYTGDYTFYTHMYNAEKINRYLVKYFDELLHVMLYGGEKFYSSLVSKQIVMKSVSTAGLVLVMILFTGVAFYFNRRLTLPLLELSAVSRQIAAGNFSVRVHESESGDAVSVLAKSFNIMSGSIKSMMENLKKTAEIEQNLLEEKLKNIEYEQLLNRANFLALQTQTNPHFMFNTLNTISRTITLGMENEAVTMIDSMVSLLRYNLTNAEEPSTLTQEIAITGEYLKIQQLRFQDRIYTVIDAAPDIADQVVIPRFTLQPIVENAIIHGLEPKIGRGGIKIKISRRGDNCIIKVIDNGVGISRERLKEILSRGGDSDAGHMSSIGIFNTAQRVRMFTGSDESFRLMSKKGLGTVAVITIPIKRGGSRKCTR